MSGIEQIGEDALNKTAEVGISSQLDEVEDLDVDIKSNPIKAVQGEVDEVTIEGEGMVMQKDLRMEKMEMQVDNVAINPMQAAFGKIELKKPTTGSAKVVLTQEDINRAFNSDYVRSQLQSQKIEVNGELMTVTPQKVDLRLTGKGNIALTAAVLLQETREMQTIAFSAVPKVIQNGETITLENIEYDNGQEISPELTKALVNQTSEILNLSNFDLEGMDLRVKELEIETGKLTINAEAYVEKIPNA